MTTMLQTFLPVRRTRTRTRGLACSLGLVQVSATRSYMMHVSDHADRLCLGACTSSKHCHSPRAPLLHACYLWQCQLVLLWTGQAITATQLQKAILRGQIAKAKRCAALYINMSSLCARPCPEFAKMRTCLDTCKAWRGNRTWRLCVLGDIWASRCRRW